MGEIIFWIVLVLFLLGWWGSKLEDKDDKAKKNISKSKNNSKKGYKFSYFNANTITPNDIGGKPQIIIDFDPTTNKIKLRKMIDGELLKLTSKEIDDVLEQLKKQVKKQDGIFE